MSDLIKLLRDNESGTFAEKVLIHKAADTIAQQAEEIARLKEQSANRLIGLCKCGEEREQQAERIKELAEGAVCGDCDGSGWLENREEGRYPCTCMTEAEPYQLLEQQLAAANASLASKDALFNHIRQLAISARDARYMVLDPLRTYTAEECWQKIKSHNVGLAKTFLAAIEAHKKGEL